MHQNSKKTNYDGIKQNATATIELGKPSGLQHSQSSVVVWRNTGDDIRSVYFDIDNYSTTDRDNNNSKQKEKMKIKGKRVNEPLNQQLNIGAVSFSIFDTVYMDSPFGRYTGVVKDVKDGKMTIESHSPTGKGMMLADYEVEGTEWKKY